LYLIFAPQKKFSLIPPGDYIMSPEVRFWKNIAFCQKQYWFRLHKDQGCVDITPRFMRRLRAKRELLRIVVVATGGLGDSLWIMPFVRELRRLWPRSAILVVTETRNKPAWINFPYINGLISDAYYSMESAMTKSDEAYCFGGVATVYKQYMRKDPVEAVFDMAEIPAPKDHRLMRPHLVITIDEGKKAEAFLKEHGIEIKRDKIICIGAESSTNNRNWPIEYMIETSRQLAGSGYKVIWLGKTPELAEKVLKAEYKVPGVLNLIDDTGLRQAMSIIALSDLYIGPNSALMVIAAALEIPTIGLFGSFNPKIRCKFYTKFLPIWGRAKCSPCNEHWTECPHGHPAPCMKVISPGEVIAAAASMIKRYPRELQNKNPIE